MPVSAALCSSVRLWSPQRNKVRIQPAMMKKKIKTEKKTLLPHCTLTSLMYFLFWFGVMLIMHRAHNTLLHPYIPSSIFSFLFFSCHGLNQGTRSLPSYEHRNSFTFQYIQYLNAIKTPSSWVSTSASSLSQNKISF